MKRLGVGQRWIVRAVLLAGAFAIVYTLAPTLTGTQLSGSPATPTRPSGGFFPFPTTSSPIQLGSEDRVLWVVNPEDDTVSVMRVGDYAVVARIKVGDEPRSVTVAPNDRYAFVANAAAGTVSVIKITNAAPDGFKASVEKTLRTGAEPWNIVISPDGRRVFVANSGQDTITVINAATRGIVGHVDLRNSKCNDPDRSRHFQPRGLAVNEDSAKLYVTGFLAFTRRGGTQGSDTGKEGVVCRVDINTKSNAISAYRPAARIALAPQNTGFTIDSNGDGVADPTSAFPNQLQSIVLRWNQAYLPNIAASPSRPLRFNVDTEAFVNVIDGVNSGSQKDASAEKFLNLHLGAREPEEGKTKLFFANPWAIAFTTQIGPGTAYVVSAASDLLVKVNVDADGKLQFTVDANTTRYIDLHDPNDPATSGANAGKNPQGIVINQAATRAFVWNGVSRNVSVIDLANDRVVFVAPRTSLPSGGSRAETVLIGAEVFFSSRGVFDSIGGDVSSTNRLSSEGWQSCASCHFQGLTDGVVWQFGAGPRKSVPLNGTFDPHNSSDQRVLNYSGIFDEVEDFELNIRAVSGPGALAAPQECSAGGTGTSTFDPNHGLILGDLTATLAPCVVNAFLPIKNADRRQATITLPGGSPVPALTALREWVKFAVRTPSGPLPANQLSGPGRTGPTAAQIAAGRRLFDQAGCTTCHFGGKWTQSTKDFDSPPPADRVATETTPAATFGNPVTAQFIASVLQDIGSFNLGVVGAGNPIGKNVGAVEKATTGQDALGIDYNGDGKGIGYNVPSLLGIYAVPPYYHNGACESLACVVGNVKHRTANGTLPDRLKSAADRAKVIAFLESITAATKVFPGP